MVLTGLGTALISAGTGIKITPLYSPIITH